MNLVDTIWFFSILKNDHLHFRTLTFIASPMDISESDQSFLSNLFQHIRPAHVALLLRLIRLYPVRIVDDSMAREQAILEILNECTGLDYKPNIWPKIMSINRSPKLLEQIFMHDADERILIAIEKIQLRLELQPHRFKIHQLVPTAKKCCLCQSPLKEPIFDEIGTMITRDHIYSCVMYKSECCDLVYKYGHMRNSRTRERFITPDAIFNQKFLHLFDHVVYERRLLVSFTNLVCEAAANFQSYTNATNMNIDQECNMNNQPSISSKLCPRFFSVVCRTSCIIYLQKVLTLFIDMDLV